MKIGLYVIPQTSLTYRCIDGQWTALTLRHMDTPAKTWEYVSTAQGQPCDGKAVSANEHLELLTTSRPMARLIYGVPDDVELYQRGERP